MDGKTQGALPMRFTEMLNRLLAFELALKVHAGDVFEDCFFSGQPVAGPSCAVAGSLRPSSSKILI